MLNFYIIFKKHLFILIALTFLTFSSLYAQQPDQNLTEELYKLMMREKIFALMHAVECYSYYFDWRPKDLSFKLLIEAGYLRGTAKEYDGFLFVNILGPHNRGGIRYPKTEKFGGLFLPWTRTALYRMYDDDVPLPVYDDTPLFSGASGSIALLDGRHGGDAYIYSATPLTSAASVFNQATKLPPQSTSGKNSTSSHYVFSQLDDDRDEFDYMIHSRYNRALKREVYYRIPTK